jgi:preprotein translocase subunit SecD
VRNKLKTTDATIRISDISNNNGSLTFLVDDVTKVDAVREAILPLTSGAGLTGQRDWNIQVVDGNRFVLTPTQEGIDQAVSQAMDTAVEVVRKRIDGLGTKEPTILRQGAQRIVVQVPGLQDPQRSRPCWARPPSSNSSWWTRALPSDLARGIARLAARSCLMPIPRPAARRSRSSAWAAFAAMN